MILDEYVEVMMTGKNCKYYGDKGYPNKYKSKVMIKIEDLSEGSHAYINVKCDVCGRVSKIKYQDYLKNTNHNLRIYTCPNCKNIKYQETCLKKYGYAFATQSLEVQEKTQQTSREKYGCDHFLQNKEIQEKRKQTTIEKYGVEYNIQLEQAIKNRQKRSLELFGTENPFNSSTLQNKIKEDNFRKYGGPTPTSSPEILVKIRKTLFNNNTAPVSIQQHYLYELFGGELNYPLTYYSLDVFLPEHHLDIEYNGGGHNLCVMLGNKTEKEFQIQEIRRGRYIKSQGINQLTIISRKDYLPSDSVLLQMLEETLSYLSTTNHHWVEYDIDRSTVRNALGRFPYDFGVLRKIKKTDVQDINQDIPKEAS